MKKLALVLTVFTASIFGVNAQVQFGVKAGANFANITGGGGKTLVSFNAGALVKLPLADALSLQPEVVYSGQGAKTTISGTDYKQTLNYLNIPVLVKYTIPAGVFFETGPQIGFLMSAKAKAGDQSESNKDAFKSTDFAWAFGAGYVIPDVNLGVDVRYNLGVTKIADGSDSKNTCFQVGLFYMFGESSKK
ncbi:porin family protein [Flavitalea sp. BT771]|uniref:porin family protein n=1 Tax=Flavitalea sp. BT771 TaxID=3063329 RepID=UPI0026E2D3B6|nr:porin family protein [Flavitalea sp. BT771]MDO6435284.1 porin family protein [Flavitalea sp. BT771]MDV6224356.1 porin family protein [Flavitalea sp. BT771]